jgi:hypothetical protein
MFFRRPRSSVFVTISCSPLKPAGWQSVSCDKKTDNDEIVDLHDSSTRPENGPCHCGMADVNRSRDNTCCGVHEGRKAVSFVP